MSGVASLVPLAVGWTSLIGGLGLLFWSLRQELRERALLRRTLHDICPRGLRGLDDLVALKRFLNERVRWDPARRDDPRPLLRHSASEILERGEGFCGENARLAIRLFESGGVRAHRLYLQGPRWGHVIVEHEWEGGWRLFDGHADAATGMPDEMVGRLDPASFRSLPNSFVRNPWQRTLRNRHLARLEWLGQSRLPRWTATLHESPHLLRALAALALIAAGALVVASA